MSQNDYNPVIKIGQGSKFGIGVGIIKQFGPALAIQAQFLTGSLYSKYEVTDNILASTYFAGSLTDFGLQLRFDPLRLSKTREMKFSPYMMVGISTIQYRSVRRLWTDNTVIWPAYGYALDGVTKKPAITAMSVPMGLGISYRVLPYLDIELEHSVRLTNTDLLDCLKGATSVNDYYSLTSIGVRYNLTGSTGTRSTQPAEARTTKTKTTREPVQKAPKTRTEEPPAKKVQTTDETKKQPVQQQYAISLELTDIMVDCEIPESVQSGKLFEVKFKITKNGYKGPARLIQKFPDGFSALELQSTNCTFSFMNQQVMIEWDQMPADSIITYSYHVKAGESLSGSTTIIGRLEYQQPDGPKTIRFNKTLFIDNRIENAMDRRVQEIINETGLNPEKKETINNSMTTEQRVEELLKQYGDNPTKPSTRTGTTTYKGTANIRQAQTVPGIEFRVQCGAFRDRSQAAGILASKYGITEQIQEEYHDGYYKYTVGSFDTYEKAVRFRDAFIQRSKIWSAFIVAYRDGKRLAKITDAYR